MTTRRRSITRDIAILAAVFVLARLELVHRLASPVFGWRPADMASIALNYYRHGFHFAYPEVAWGGRGPGYVEMEFPLQPYVTALLFALFGPQEALNVVVPLASGFGIACVTYALGVLLYDEAVGVAAGLVVCCAPNLVLLTDTGMFADPPMVLFATLGLYLVARFERSGRASTLFAGAACVSLGALLKLTGLYVALPVAWLVLRREGPTFWRRAHVWVAAAIVVLPSVIWYWHAHELYVAYRNTFGIWGAGYAKFGNATLFRDPSFYSKTAERLVLYHLTPLPALAALYGLFSLVKRRDWLVLSWLASLAIYTLVTAVGVRLGHYHYLLPLLPGLALVSGLGMIQVWRRVAAAVSPRGTVLLHGTAVALIALLFANIAAASRRFTRRDRLIDSIIGAQRKVTGERTKELTPPGALIIVADTQMDDVTPEKSMTPPDVFYFADRHGWYRSFAWLTPQDIESLHRQGAGFFVVSGQSVDAFKRDRAAIATYLTSHYRRVLDDDTGVVYALDQHVN